LRMCVEYALGDPSAETISIIEALNSALRESESESGQEFPLETVKGEE